MQFEPWPGKGIGADDKKHRPLKCAHKDGITVGCPFSGSRMQVEQNSHRNQKNGDHCVRETPGMCSASGVFVNKQGLGGRGAAAHGVDPHRVVHHDVLLVGAPVG